MNQDHLNAELEKIPAEVLEHIADGMKFSMPWQHSPDSGQEDYKDPDGAGVITGSEKYSRERLQQECWNKYSSNPYMNTAVRGQVGRLTGWGFEPQSGIWDIQEVLDEITFDHRNRLYHNWPKYATRSIIEGELFQLLTLHLDGFVEVDFVDPVVLSRGGDDDSGIIFHSRKHLFPLMYILSNPNLATEEIQIPSINLARYPELIKDVSVHKDYDRKFQQSSRSRKHKYRAIGGFTRFIVAWDKGILTKRATSYLRTTLEWLNHYENLKKYEIDHKKSSGAYLWVFTIEDARTFKMWLQLTDEERRTTGILAKKTPGSSLVLPPGISVECKNPNLTSLSGQDTDIKELVTAGLNEADDAMTGSAKGTYASVKATRGPMSDRTSDEIAYFDRWLKFDFWSAVFFLRSIVTDFPKLFKIRKVVGFKQIKEDSEEDPDPIIKNVQYPPERLMKIKYPVSEMLDYESRAKGLMGSKHGAVTDTLGIPNSEVVERMGFGDHTKMRLDKATEDISFPKLVLNEDAESEQEKALARTPAEGASKKKAPAKEKK